jgi:hypothetical protein
MPADQGRRPVKRIFQIDHSARVTATEADRHYETVHSPFARDLILREAPAIRQYAWNRVVASRDLRGGFELSPTAWRFILFDLDSSVGSASILPAGGGQQLIGDHVNFLTNMRPFDVDCQLAVDRRSGQCVSAKFVVTVDAEDESDTVARRHDEVVADLADGFRRAEGARLLLVNRVTAESRTEPINEPGQRYAGSYLERSRRASIDELYFDNHLAGREFFARPEVGRALDAMGGVVRAHLVREWVAVDRR